MAVLNTRKLFTVFYF